MLELICEKCRKHMILTHHVALKNADFSELGQAYICPNCNHSVIVVDPTALLHSTLNIRYELEI